LNEQLQDYLTSKQIETDFKNEIKRYSKIIENHEKKINLQKAEISGLRLEINSRDKQDVVIQENVQTINQIIKDNNTISCQSFTKYDQINQDSKKSIHTENPNKSGEIHKSKTENLLKKRPQSTMHINVQAEEGIIDNKKSD